MLFIKDIVLWNYWNPLKAVVQRLPAKVFYRIAKILGLLYYYFASEKRRRFEREYKLIVGREAEKDEIKQTVLKTFKVLVCNELEVLLFPVLNENNISSFVLCSGLEHLDNALSLGKGAMLLFAHFGANQMVMPAIGYRGYTICQLSAPANAWKKVIPDRNFSWMEEQAMEKRWRHELSLPVKHVNIFGSIKEAFSCLKRNEVLGIAIDGGGGKKRVAVKFLNRRALFSIGTVEIARRTGCTILPTFMVRNKNGTNTLIIEPPLPVDSDDGIDKTGTRTTQRLVQHIEVYVRKYPCHYLNFLALRNFMSQKGDTPFFTEQQP